MKKNILVSLTLLAISTVVFSLVSASQANALSGSDFQPGRIIDDDVFYDGDSMTESQIQNFLNSKVPSCDTNGEKSYSYYYNSGTGEVNNANNKSDGDTWVTTTRATYGQRIYNDDTYHGPSYGSRAPYTCLKDYKQDTTNIAPESGLCAGYTGASNETAARIIRKVAASCNVSPKVILVMLHKEQGLITDDWPFGIQYRKAMGAFCPDTAPCDPSYSGFFYQVYYGSHRFKVYRANQDSFNYKAGRNNTILWNPNTACGTSTVYIENQATAGLYIYTPYRPNKAALDNYPSEGNNCSAYGNRNFWFKFHEWFGSPYSNQHLFFTICNDQKYVVEKNSYRKRLVTSAAVQAWGLSDGDFMTNGFGCDLPTFSLNLGRFIRSRTTGKVYLVDKGKTHYVQNQALSNAWGLGDLNQSLPQFNGTSIKSKLKVGSTLPRVATSDNTSVRTVYLIDGGNRYSIAGTSTGDTTSLQLVRGYDEVPMGTFSVALLQTLNHTSSIDYSFKIGTDWYLLDHNKTRQVIGDGLSVLNDTNLTGPTLSTYALSIFGENRAIEASFRRGDSYYRMLNNTSMEHTFSSYVTNNWGLSRSNSPMATRLLKNKLVAIMPSSEIYGVDGNIRLISCSGKKYLIERYIAKKRGITDEGLGRWNFADKYYAAEDRGCDYPAFSLEVNELVRSRNTGKVYYIENAKAYHVHSQAAADKWGFGDISETTYPKFEGKSLHDTLDVIDKIPDPS